MATDHPIDAAMTTLQTDLPRISDAMKNFCAFLAATDLTAGDKQSKDKAKPHDFQHLLAIAKAVLKIINAHALAPPDAWAQRHPQAEEESGTERIEGLTMYRACHGLRAHAATAPGAKVTKLFGRRYLRATRMWEDGVGEAAAAELARLRYPEHTVHAFLTGWATAVSPGDDAAAADCCSLVWAADFNEALRARRAARDQEVRERVERMDASGSEADALREALAAEERMKEGPGEGDGGGEDGNTSEEADGPRIVEVV